MEQFKTLIFTDERKNSLGKYAHFSNYPSDYWLGSDVPDLINKSVTIKQLKESFSRFNYTGVKLISVYVLPVKKAK